LSIIYAQQQTDTLNIFFDIDKSAVDSNNLKPLKELISNPNIISISIYGYADFLGSAAYNQQLSEKRSENVREYLINKGINERNIILFEGKGIYPNSAEKSRQNFSDRGIKAHRTVQVVYTVKSIQKKLTTENLIAGNLIVLENILFYPASEEFCPEAYPDLEELFDTMQKYPTLKIEIQGHICCLIGDDYSNGGKPLSVSRAKAVYDYLIKEGIAPARMTYKGFGSYRRKYPFERNKYEEDMNKRVEILILEK
jgi:outer membrane protein OmpA-like peptidoglycan-associated protein